jgi:HK97 family phage major capsid protein
MSVILDRLLAERTALLDEAEHVTHDAQEQERDLSQPESDLITRNLDRADQELTPQIERLERLDTIRATHNATLARSTPPPPEPHPGTPARGGEPEVIYRTFAEYARDELIRRFDAIAQLAGPPAVRVQAIERLDRAVANTLSSDVAGLIPPQYLTTLVQVIDTSRPVVESSRRVGLTSGKLSYPMITQRPQVGKQTAEKTEAPSRKVTVAFTDVLADTYVGAGDISWQAMNWSTPDALVLWFDLMAEQYAMQTEAAAGSVLTAVGTTPVDVGSDDLEGWYAAIMAAAGSIYGATRHRADTIYASIDEGYKIMGLVSSASPVFVTGGTFSIASGAGNVAGLRLVISPELPPETVIVGASSSLLCAETSGAPVQLRAVEPALGGMEVGIIGAFVAKVVEPAAFVPLTAP